jgi:hypothetical protein
LAGARGLPLQDAAIYCPMGMRINEQEGEAYCGIH